ncbi:uncharacterized protein [Rutidosis leptorrhynchoides]|uniref:uncharacterized protein n=1 Tax=Rutidosis leptorrhynchoides TaxID=125765 RepID=UPI003A99B981
MAGDEAETSTKNTIDISSPYYLTSADQPDQNFTGENLLHDRNYSDWRNELMNALFAKNKKGFIDGTIPKPDSKSKDPMNWERCNAMVRGWLINSMVKEIKNSVKYAVTAREIWTDLDERFNKKNASRDEIQSVSPLPSCSCNNCTCNVSKSIASTRDKDRLYDFLMGLNEEYNTVRTQILSSNPIPTVGAAFHLVNQDEQQRIIGNSCSNSSEVSAFQTMGQSAKSTSKQNNQK